MLTPPWNTREKMALALCGGCDVRTVEAWILGRPMRQTTKKHLDDVGLGYDGNWATSKAAKLLTQADAILAAARRRP
jgi:hypothetical protein